MDKEMVKVSAEEQSPLIAVEQVQCDIRRMIYVVRNQQVMLDSDLAMLYQVETKALNRAVKRNIKRFPEDFCFQLTTEEFEFLKCQIGTSKMLDEQKSDGRGGRRTLPYVFTEQGISMLASVLHSEVAVNVSISIMRTFVEMRRFISNNALLFERISAVELRQLEYQKQTDVITEGLFPVSDCFQNLILVAPAVDDAEYHDIFFLLINQVIRNIVLHQYTPDVIPFQIGVVDRPACFWCLTDFFQLFFQFIRKGRSGVGIHQLICDIIKGFIDIRFGALRQNVIVTIRCHVSPSAFSGKTSRLSNFSFHNLQSRG